RGERQAETGFAQGNVDGDIEIYRNSIADGHGKGQIDGQVRSGGKLEGDYAVDGAAPGRKDKGGRYGDRHRLGERHDSSRVEGQVELHRDRIGDDDGALNTRGAHLLEAFAQPADEGDGDLAHDRKDVRRGEKEGN